RADQDRRAVPPRRRHVGGLPGGVRRVRGRAGRSRGRLSARLPPGGADLTAVPSPRRRRTTGRRGGVMFPSTFDYVVATALEEAVSAKAEAGDEARFLAGGQSLLPMMKIRLANPAALIDINRLPGLDTIERVNGHL